MYLHRESKGYINACKVQEKLMNKKIFSFPKSKIRKKIPCKLEEEYKQLFLNLRPNLKNLSHVLNLSRGSNMVGIT